jgi:uncharacterized protein YjiS (DUF1127 family)
MRFTHCCGATLLVFRRQNIPILRLIRFTGPGPVRERKRIIMIAALVRFLTEWKRYNRSLSELNRLGDRELADIGISRSDIPRIAWNTAHKH